MERAEVEAKINARLLRQRKDDIKFMLEYPQTRRVLFGLIEATGTFSTSFTGNSGSYFNDGRKSVGLELFHEIMAQAPDKFTEMWTEHHAAQAQIDQQLAESEE